MVEEQSTDHRRSLSTEVDRIEHMGIEIEPNFLLCSLL